MTWNKTDLAFKKFLNKRVTDAEPAKYFYNEKGDFTIDIHAIEIKRETIPGTPPGASTSIVGVYTLAAGTRLTLIEDQSVPNKQAWFATSNSNTTLAQTDEASRLKDWISDKYGTAYEIKLYDNSNVQIPKSDASEWYFDYPTGILIFKNANTDSGTVISRAPFKIDAYRYIGAKGVGLSTSDGDARYLKLAADNDPLTGRLDLAAQSTTVAPIKFTSGSLLSSPLAGALEFDGTNIYVTQDSGPTRKQITFGSGTPDTLPKWSSSNTLADSIITESGNVITVNGTLKTTVSKSFFIPHPTKPGMYLEHGCLEGPENGAYQRGRVSGRGKVRIELPDYWAKLIGNDYTVTLTPYLNCGLYVSEQDETGFTVSRSGWWFSRMRGIDFSYLVIGNRADAPLILESECK